MHKIKYVKPVGIQSSGRHGGIRLGNNQYWLKDFDYQNMLPAGVPYLKNAYYTTNWHDNILTVTLTIVWKNEIKQPWGSYMEVGLMSPDEQEAWWGQFTLILTDSANVTHTVSPAQDFGNISKNTTNGGLEMKFKVGNTGSAPYNNSWSETPFIDPSSAKIKYIPSSSYSAVNIIDTDDNKMYKSSPQEQVATMSPIMDISCTSFLAATQAASRITNAETLDFIFTPYEYGTVSSYTEKSKKIHTVNFTENDITAFNGSISNFTKHGKAGYSYEYYTATFTPDHGTDDPSSNATSYQITCKVNITNDKFINKYGISNTASNEYTFVQDDTPPNPVITPNPMVNNNLGFTHFKSGSEPLFTFTSSEDTSDFDPINDVVVYIDNVVDTSPTITRTLPTLPNKIYTATIVPSAEGVIEIEVPTGKFTDAAGNQNSGSGKSEQWTYDTTSPTISFKTSSPPIATGGTVVANYWNNTNTGLDITLELDSNDASIIGGNIQIQMHNGTWSTLTGGALPSTITESEKNSGTKVIQLTSGQLGILSTGNTIKFRPIIKDKAENSVAGAESSNIDVDVTSPVVAESSAITTPSNNTTPSLIFTSTKAGTLTTTCFDGFTSSADAVQGSNTRTFSTLDEDTYENKTVTVTDTAGNSGSFTITTFVIDTTPPSLSSVSIASSNSNTTLAKENDTITLTITSNENISAPSVEMTIGSGTSFSASVSGSGTSWTATHQVQAGETGGVAFVIGYTDIAGNAGSQVTSVTDSTAVTVDTTAPTVNTTVHSITSTKSDGSYKAGVEIDITVKFSETVTVSGTPQLTLETGTSDAVVNFYGGSGTDTLTFRYTVGAGHTSADLDYASTSALALNGGTIKDAAGNNAVLTLPSPGATGSLGNSKAIVIDTTAPTVSNVTSSTGDGTYKIGDTISIQVVFDETIVVTGTPQLTLETGTSDAVVNYNTVTGLTTTTITDDTMTFTYTVGAGHENADLDYESTAALALNTGTIKDVAGNDATLTLVSPGAAGSLAANKNIVIDGIAPTLVSVVATNDTYKIGDNIDITVTWDETVNVTATPTLALSNNATATYQSGTGSAALVFRYTVQNLDQDSSDLSVSSYNGTIQDVAGNTAGAVSGDLGAVIVDANRPTVSSVTASNADATYGIGDTIGVQVVFSESVTVNGTPQITLETGTSDAVVDFTSGSGSTTLLFNYVVAEGHIASDLDYASTSALALNSGTIKDAAGNDATLTLVSPSTAGSLGHNKDIVIDGIKPTMTIASTTSGVTDGSTTNDASIDLTFTSSKSTSDFVHADITVNNGTLGTLSGSGTSYTATFTPTGDGACTIDVAADKFEGPNGNKNAAADQFNWTYDGTAPAGFSVGNVTTTGGTVVANYWNSTNSSIDIIVPIANDSSLEGGTLQFKVKNATSSYANLGSAYTIQNADIGNSSFSRNVADTVFEGVTGVFGEDETITFNADITDTYGNGPTEGTASGTTLMIVETKPTMTIGSTTSGVTNGSTTNDATIDLTFTSSKGTSDFVHGDITVTNGTLGTLSGSGTSYTATFTPTGDGACTIDVAADTFTEIAGNGNTAATQFVWTYDGTAPTITSITASWGAVLNATEHTSNGTVTVATSGAEDGQTVTLTLNSNDYTGSVNTNSTSITVAAVDLQALTDGATYDMSANVSDAAGNAATEFTTSAGNGQFTVDTSIPTVNHVEANVSSASYKIGDTIGVQVVFTEAVVVSGGTPQITLETGTSDAVVDYDSGSGSTTLLFNYVVIEGHTTLGNDLDYTSTTALALNGSTITSSSGENSASLDLPTPGSTMSLAGQKNIIIDGIKPTMTIGSTTSGVTDGSTTNDTSIDLTFTSSESTTDFAVGDITVNNGSLSSFSGSGTSYTATFTPSAGDPVVCTIDVAGGAFTDAVGNDNAAADQFNWTYDSTA